MARSIIYRNIRLYRLVMGFLYRGGYGARFMRVAGLIGEADRTVLELCFGDVAIAEHCRQSGRTWVGLDMSDEFVAHAVKLGFDARKQDVLRTEAFPVCDVCVMMGSLYHFAPQLRVLFRRIEKASTRFLLSEPVKNWMQAKGALGFLARKLTKAGDREETFRFDEPSLVRTLEALKAEMHFNYRVVSVARDMVVEVVWSK